MELKNPPQHLIPFSGTQSFGGTWQVLLLVVNRWEILGKTLRNTFGQFLNTVKVFAEVLL